MIVARLIWRWMPGHQVSSLGTGWVRTLSKAVHYVMYILLVAQAASGFAWRWAQGHSVGFFGVFGIPGPYGALDRGTRHELHDIHTWVGWSIVIIALGHALAALYHHYALHDRVLGRMFPPVGDRKRPSRRRADPEMVGELASIEAMRVALGIERQHRCVPRLPRGVQGGEALRLAILEVGALERIGDHVEQEPVAVDLQIFPVAAPAGALAAPW